MLPPVYLVSCISQCINCIKSLLDQNRRHGAKTVIWHVTSDYNLKRHRPERWTDDISQQENHSSLKCRDHNQRVQKCSGGTCCVRVHPRLHPTIPSQRPSPAAPQLTETSCSLIFNQLILPTSHSVMCQSVFLLTTETHSQHALLFIDLFTVQ